MLGSWRSHSDYQTFLISRLMEIYETNTTIVEYYSSRIYKFYNLNLDVIKPLINPMYSLTGKPSNQQTELLRSFILMSDLGFNSLPKWIKHLRARKFTYRLVSFAIPFLK